VHNLSQLLEIADDINTAGILDGLMVRVKSVLLLYRVLLMARNIIAVRQQLCFVRTAVMYDAACLQLPVDISQFMKYLAVSNEKVTPQQRTIPYPADYPSAFQRRFSVTELSQIMHKWTENKEHETIVRIDRLFAKTRTQYL
jgi:hypothetical protein